MNSWISAYEDATLRLWTQRELLVASWFDAPTIAQMREVGRAGRALGAASPRGSALANVIVGGVPRFTDEVRDEGIRIARDRTFRRGSCHLILASGLGGAATRAFLSMVLLVGMKALTFRSGAGGLGKGAPRSKVFGEVGAAAAWTAELLGGEWSSAEVFDLYRAAAKPTGP